MDLPCTSWQKHVEQKWHRLESEQRKFFTSLTEIEDLFVFAFTLTTQEDLDALLCVAKVYVVSKDTVQAAKRREKGNTSFCHGDYTAAIFYYTQGVRFAPSDSEQLSLCYANRSAALYRLQHYQECLLDIAKALDHGYPAHLQSKLKQRHAQCTERLSELQHRQPQLPKSSSGDQAPPNGGETANLQFPCKHHVHKKDQKIMTSPRLAVNFKPEKGRHLVARENIAAGDVILKDEPYSFVLIPGRQELKGKENKIDPNKGALFGTEERLCHQCLSETFTPVPCEGCSYSQYCSCLCRQKAWLQHHQWECPIGASLRVTGVMSQLALRVALKAGLKGVQSAREPIAEGGTGPVLTPQADHVFADDDSTPGSSCSLHNIVAEPTAQYHGDSYLSIYHLLHHLNSHSSSLRFLCAMTVSVLYRSLSQVGPPPLSWDFRGGTIDNMQSQSSQDDGDRESGWRSECRVLGSVVLRHMLQLMCNSQALSKLEDTGTTRSMVQSNQEIRIATAIFPILSMLNHSCCPNTSLVFCTGDDLSPPSKGCRDQPVPHGDPSQRGLGDVIVTVRAVRDIAPGQEIFHCYGPHSSRMRLHERRRLLQDQYHFLCECESCRAEEEGQSEEGLEEAGVAGRAASMGLRCETCSGSLKDCRGSVFVCLSCNQHISHDQVRQRIAYVRESLQKAVDLMEKDQPDEALELLQRTASLVGRSLSETHPLQGEMADAMARAYAWMGDWKKAASLLERSVVATSNQYGEDSIELARQLFKLAQLHFNGGSSQPAMSIIPQAKKLLSLHCGPDCHELLELCAMEECLQ